MEIKYNVTGARRKALVQAVSEIADWPASYSGAPTFAYEIGDFIVDKEGTLSFSDRTDSELVEKLLDGLAERGFELESSDRLTIEMPREGFTDAALENLERLIASKAALIKKAVGADSLPIEQTKETLRFPWFAFDASPDEVKAYARLVGALCAMAKTLQRVNATPKETVDNEKFAFRCFLLRLGFIGDEYKTERKVLLAPLSGNTAFKSGHRAPEVLES